MPKRVANFRPIRIKSNKDTDTDRPNAAQRGYCSSQHRAWRKAIFTRDGFRCVRCGSPHRLQADHIVRIEDGGSRYGEENGQTLCISCHSKKTAAEVGWTKAVERR